MRRTKFPLLTVLILIFSILCSACKTKQASEVDSKSQNPTEINIISHSYSQSPASNDSLVEQEIERFTNTKLNIQWISSNNYDNKMNVMLSSLDLPDLVLIRDPFNPVFRKAAEEGVFWNLSSYIKDYPNLTSKIGHSVWEVTKINGGNFGVPRPRPSEGEPFLIVRKDWLNNVGLKPPSTAEELYQVMKAFTIQDPDQNGKDDTIGFAGQVNPMDMGSLANFEGIFTGVNGDWKLVGEKLVYTALLPEQRKALVFLANAYKDKLIPVDFASLQETQAEELFKDGKAGIISEKSGAMQEYYSRLKKINPNFEFMNLLPLSQINNYNPKGLGFIGINAIPKSVPEEKMKNILLMLDRWMDQDVFLLHKQGIKGVHHTVENGKVIINTKKMAEDSIADFNQIVYVSDPYASTVKATFPKEVQRLYKQVQDERAKNSTADISAGLYSKTDPLYPQKLKTQIMDLKTKIILGEKSIIAWDDFMAKLKRDERLIILTEEINQAYQNRYNQGNK